ncbi:nucleotidyltransferase domain-containing protein, partial [bacterium]|nr:nucleotidyltransferase domain-containing protein [bacterium]
MVRNRNQVISYLKKFREEKTSKYHIERIGVFGSVAKETASEKSDLDIVVKLSKQDMFDIIGIKQDLEEGLNV